MRGALEIDCCRIAGCLRILPHAVRTTSLRT